MSNAASENDGIFEIISHEFNSYELIPCLGSATKRALISWTVLRKTRPLELTHSDVSEKIGISSSENAKYFVVFVDDSIAVSIVYILKKSELLNAFKAYKTAFQNQKIVNM